MRVRKGFVMVFALVIMALMILSLTALFFISYNDLALSTAASKSMRAYYLAEAGVAQQYMKLRDGGVHALDPTPATNHIFNDGTGTYSATALQALPNTSLTSTGTYKGVSRKVELIVKQQYFFIYGYLSNDEDAFAWASPIWFVTGDILDGDVRSNDYFNISGNPIFKGAVTTAKDHINYNHGGPPNDNPDFQVSLTFNAPVVKMPSDLNVTGAVKGAAAANYTFNGNTVITFLSDGTMNVKIGNHATNNMALPANGAVYVTGGTVDISGTLKGNLTVGSDNNIYIVNSGILYNTNPRTNPNSTDMLNLVSGSNIYVDKNAQNNVEIDAYLVANQSFGVENYDTISAKGALSLYGGVTQNRRGGVGTFNSSTNQKVSGYTKNYVYDPRMKANTPVYFPAMQDDTGRILYDKVEWQEI